MRLIRDRWTPDSRMRCAVVAGDVEAINTLINNGDNVDNPVRFDGMTAVIWAIRGGHVAAAECLIRRGARLHVRGTLGNHSALYYAVKHGHTELV